MKKISNNETPEIEYSIPYNWGHLHMTERAHQAYKVIPLTPVIEGGSDEYNNIDGSPSIDITVRVPEEEFTEPVRPIVNRRQKSLVTSVTPGLDSKTVEASTERALMDLIDIFGSDIPEGEIEKISSQIKQDTPQKIGHLITELSMVQTQREFAEHLQAEADKRSVRQSRAVGAIGVAGGAMILSLTSLLGGEGASPESIAIATGYSGYGVYKMGRLSKDYLKNRQLIKQGNGLASSIVAEVVGEDIHRSFCRRHFDSEFEV